MSAARDAILRRIRSAVGESPAADNHTARQYCECAPVDLARFEDRLVDYGVRVYHAGADLPAAIALALANAAKTRLLVPTGFPREHLPQGPEFVIDAGLSYAELDSAEGVVTGCAVAIAETGTIILRHTEAEGRRALTLIPDYHLCIVRADQVVATVPEAIRAASAFATAPITTISGPSATSDIEMTRVKGVHGPRTLQVILLQ